LKRLRSDRAGSIISVRRFEFEIELGRLLRHPNLVAVRESGVVGDRQFMFMEEVRGPSLRRILQGNAPWQVTTQGLLLALEQIARGMAFVHRAGVVHCDLKPENVLFHSLKQPVVIDFGLAFRKGGPNPNKGVEDTRVSGYIMGTPMYMPPETITGQILSATPAADIYSFGVMLYEVLAGRPPFVMDVSLPKQTALMNLIEQVVSVAPPPLRSLQPEASEAWELLCASCLEKKPSHRPQSLDRLAQDVGAIVRTGQPLPQAQQGMVRRMTGWFRKPG
jgi:serine/threonine-protein kinase